MRPEDLNPSDKDLLDEITASGDVKIVLASCYSDEGVMDVKNTACDLLLAHRVETKLKGAKIHTVANRIHVAVPKPRDDVAREPFIPDVVRERKKYDKDDPERRRLEKDLEMEEGGAGVYNINLRSRCFISCIFHFPWFTDDAFQKITSLPMRNGKMIEFLKLWTARMSLTLLTLILRKS